MADEATRQKRIWKEFNLLKNIGPDTDARYKFIIEKTPFGDNDDGAPLIKGDVFITGRILPMSNLYNQVSLPIDIKLGSQFPLKPPEVRFLTPMYHPNVDKDGMISIDLLSGTGRWTLTSTLKSVVEEVTKIVDEPCTDYVLYPEAAASFKTNNPQYRQLVSDMIKKNGLPRN